MDGFRFWDGNASVGQQCLEHSKESSCFGGVEGRRADADSGSSHRWAVRRIFIGYLDVLVYRDTKEGQENLI